MKIILALLFLSIKVAAAGGEWIYLPEQGVFFPATTATNLCINPRFEGVQNYVVEPGEVLPGHIPAFQIKFTEEGSLQISRTAIPNTNSEGNGLTNIYVQNSTVNGDFCDLGHLIPGSDNWVRSVVELQDGQTTNYFGKNYRTTGEILEYVCLGLDLYNTIFQGTSPLVLKSPKSINTLNPLFSLMIQPFDLSDSDINLSGSIFAEVGGAFISGVVEFNKADGVRGNEPGNPFFLISCEQLILTVKGRGTA